MSGYATCDRCQGRIIWVPLNGRQCPLNRGADDQGEIWAYQNAAGGWHARPAVVAGEVLAAPWKRYAIHPASCAETADVTVLDDYRAARPA